MGEDERRHISSKHGRVHFQGHLGSMLFRRRWNVFVRQLHATSFQPQRNGDHAAIVYYLLRDWLRSDAGADDCRDGMHEVLFERSVEESVYDENRGACFGTKRVLPAFGCVNLW